MTCPNLCTAAKCEELENRISKLENDLQILTGVFNSHVNQEIPEAHNFNPSIKVETNLLDNILITKVDVNGIQDNDDVELPTFEPNVITDIIPLGNNQYEFTVSVNDITDSAILTLDDILDITVSLTSEDEVKVSLQLGDKFTDDSTSLPNSNVSVDVFNNNDESALIKVQVGKDSDQDIIYFPESKHVESNLKINGSIAGNSLNLTVADGESFDSVNIPFNLNDNPETIFITEEIYMDCDNLETKIDDCCALLSNQINNLSLQLTSAETSINNSVDEVFEAVTPKFIHKVKSRIRCEFPVNEDGTIIPSYALSTYDEEVSYEDTGILGIVGILSTIFDYLDVIHSDVCKAVDPIQEITLEDMYNFCDKSDIKRSNFNDDEDGEERYNEALNDYFFQLQKDSKYGYLIRRDENENKPAASISLLTAPTNWTNYILTDFSLIQSRINRNEICDLDTEPVDVVAIVASEKDVHRVKEKVLILHFVTLDAYPKRSADQGYRAIQIPAAKESYDWEIDFNDLRWEQGNQFAQLSFEEPYVSISGWFKDEDAANAYFDQVLTLTNATEDNRNMPKHTNPKTAVPVQLSRPYRAFITSVNSKGKAICHTKYVPVIEE